MKKNNTIFLLIFFILLITIASCSKNNIKKGILYSKSYSDLNYDASKIKAIDSIYYYIAEQTAEFINRNDFNVVAVHLKDKNLIDFNNKEISEIKQYEKDNNFYTEIRINDNTIYERTLEILNKIKKEGSIGDKFFRANASIEITENAKLSAYTRQMLTQNALKRAYHSLYKILIDSGIEVNDAAALTNNAYILEESYTSNEYNVVVETELE